MTIVSRKRAKVKKKKKTASKKKARKVSKKTTKKSSRKVSKKVTPKRKKKARPSGTIKKTGKAVKKISKRSAKRKVKARGKRKRKKRGALRDWADNILGTRQAHAQIAERLMEKLPGIFLPGLVETDESLMLQRMIRAEQLGAFEETARNLAVEFDWNLRDVYELWHSPDMYF